MRSWSSSGLMMCSNLHACESASDSAIENVSVSSRSASRRRRTMSRARCSAALGERDFAVAHHEQAKVFQPRDYRGGVLHVGLTHAVEFGRYTFFAKNPHLFEHVVVAHFFFREYFRNLHQAPVREINAAVREASD